MRNWFCRFPVWPALVVSALVAWPAFAQTGASAPARPEQVQQLRDDMDRLKKEFEAVREQYNERISAIERLLAQLSGPSAISLAAPPEPVPQQPQTPPPTPPEPTQPSPSQPNLAGSSKVFNPDTSVIANFVGVGGKNPMSGQPSMQVTEAEVAFQAIVDPYARADFFLSAGPEGLEIEEGFITFNTLPGNLLLKAGKMRAMFGKVNTLHTHAMPTVDRPLVTNNLVGGEEGISDAGLSLSKLFPNNLVFLEATGEVFSGHSEVFQASERSRLNYVGRLRAYRDLTEGTNLDFGVSIADGPTDTAFEAMNELLPVPREFNRQLIGIDATFRYRPLRRAIYKRFQARTELIWSKQDLFTGDQANAFGWYGLAEYQFNRRWYIGGRVDQSDRALDASLRDSGASVFLTFWPSEFSQIRGQYRRTNYAESAHANEFLFQFNFSIGAHGAHVF